MGLSLSSAALKNFLVKHSFNADEDSENLLTAAEKVMRDKTEFINRCIQQAGPLVIRAVNEERNRAVAELLSDKPPGKTQGRLNAVRERVEMRPNSCPAQQPPPHTSGKIVPFPALPERARRDELGA